MKQILSIIVCIVPLYCLSHGDQVHKKIQQKARVTHHKIRETLQELKEQIDHRVTQKEHDRLFEIHTTIMNWQTDRVNMYQPAVLHQLPGENSFFHALKNIVYITSIFGMANPERIHEQCRYLVDKETFVQFYQQYAHKHNLDRIIIAPKHRSLAIERTCPFIVFDPALSWHDQADHLCSYMQNHVYCCIAFIIPSDENHFFALIVYKANKNIYYLLADSLNEPRYDDVHVQTIIQALEKKGE